jgi:hypothetical protein
MLQQTHYTQNTGIGSFAESSPDYELAPVGLGSFQDQVKKLAEFGRNGDIYVVHAAEGETVIPLEVLNANPKVRELLFGQMREMGLDPQEFVIGNELNSINPVTGLPEFFFKSIFRSVKKAVKKVAKVAKKLAPIILPLAASAFGIPFLGPAFGAGTFGAAFLGGGIGTLAGGGSLKDAFKSGLVSGGTSLAFSGIGSLFNKGTSFGDAVTANLTGRTPVYGLDNLGKKTLLGYKMAASPGADWFSSGDAAKASAAASEAQWGQILGGDPIGGVTGEFFGTPTKQSPGFVPLGTMPTDLLRGSSQANQLAALKQQYLNGELTSGQLVAERARILRMSGTPAPTGGVEIAGPMEEALAETTSSQVGRRAPDRRQVSLDPRLYRGGDMMRTPPPPKITTTAETPGFFDKAGDLLFGKPPSDRTLHQAAAALVENNPTLYGPATDRGAERAMEYVTKKLSPGPIRKYGPTAALGLAGTYFGGGFDPQEGDETTVADLAGVVPRGLSGAELIEQDPSQYLVQDIDPTQFTPEGTPLIPTTFPALLAESDTVSPAMGSVETADLRDRYANRAYAPWFHGSPPKFPAPLPGGPPPLRVAAEGGMAEFPRRDLLVEGPGTTRSDDIPAMLSDGEFVMNARAVRGADPTGQRNRYAGAQNLYNMMRNFEMKA